MSRPEFDHLPDLCLRQIFSCLGVRDLVKCRTVGRLFKFYADQTEVNELVLVNKNGRSGWVPRKWYHWYLTKRSIDFQGSISFERFLSLSPLLTPSPFSWLRVKFVCIYKCTDLNMNFLNCFERLVHLDITFHFTEFGVQRELAHPNLRILTVCQLFYSSLVLTTPRLEALRSNEIGSVELEYPDTIKKLESDCTIAIAVAKFKKIEVFRTPIHDSISRLNLNKALSVWKHLKELDLYLSRFKDQVLWNGKSGYEAFIRSLGHLLRTTSRSGEKLKIYLNNVLLEQDQLEDLDFEFMKNLKNFQLKHYRQLRAGSYPDVTQVNYSNLMSWTGQLSDDFFVKFSSICTVEASGDVDRGQFEWFLKHAKNLRYLVLTDLWLDQDNQAFLDNLPKLAGGLTDLAIKEKEKNKNKNKTRDFNLILQLPCLCKFRTNQQFKDPLNLVQKMFQQVKTFNEFIFNQFGIEGNETVFIDRKSSGDRFQLVISSEFRIICFCRNSVKLNELVALCEERRRKEGGKNEK